MRAARRPVLAVLAVLALCARAPGVSAEPAPAELDTAEPAPAGPAPAATGPAGALPAPADPKAYDEATNPFIALNRTGCSSAVIAATELCLRQVASALVVADKCSNFAAFSKCWPECFCDHPDGYAKITLPLHNECQHLPPCGSAA